MVDITDVKPATEYKFIIDQRGHEYEAVVRMDTRIAKSTGTAVGIVQESTYPNDSWEGEQFRFHKDGIVDRHRDPFGAIGKIVRIEEHNR
jgi:hypothetical protein